MDTVDRVLIIYSSRLPSSQLSLVLGMNNPASMQQSYGYGPMGQMMGQPLMASSNQGPIPSTNDPYDPYGKRPENQLTAQQQQQQQGNQSGVVNADGGNWQAQNWQRVCKMKADHFSICPQLNATPVASAVLSNTTKSFVVWFACRTMTRTK